MLYLHLTPLCADGFAVSGVLIITTTMLAISVVHLKHLPVLAGIVFFLFFGFLDGLFWGATLPSC